MTIRRTRFQRTRRPVRVAEVLCTSRAALDRRDMCPDCGRWLKRGGQDHKPARSGSLGWIEHYSDGTTRHIENLGD